MQQKSVHLQFLRFISLIISILRMSTFNLDDRLNPPRDGGCQCCTNLWRDVLPFFKDHFTAGLCQRGCVVLLFSYPKDGEYPKGVLWIQVR